MKPATSAIQFRRPRVEVTDYDFQWQIRESIDGSYRVTVSRCLLGPQEGPKAFPVRVYAAVRNERGGWDVLGRHKRESAAVARCERHRRMAAREARRAEKEARRKERAEARKAKARRLRRRMGRAKMAK